MTKQRTLKLGRLKSSYFQDKFFLFCRFGENVEGKEKLREIHQSVKIISQ